jgi:thermitase
MYALPTGLLALAVAFAAFPLAAQAAAPERLVVSFHGAPAAQEHGRYLGAEVLQVDAALRMAVVAAPDGASFREQAKGRPEVRAVEPDAVAHADFAPSDPEFGVSQYGPQFIGAPAAWDTTLGGNTTLCVVDSGVRATHQDLAAAYAGGIDLVNGDSDPADDNGHGTHVAGIAAARTGNGVGIAGIAQSRLLVVKALDAGGNGYLSTVATGVRWCADHGAQVISMSLGATAGLAAMADAVDYAWGKGAVLVAAAGNGGCTDCVQYPARYANVVAVGCVDQTRAPCSFTSQGPEVDLAGPGNAIQSTWWTSDTALMRAAGTSMSAPHVAGAAALVFAAHPGWSNAQVRQALESSAQDVGAAGPDTATGKGLVRADLAIAANVTGTPAPSPSPPAASHGVVLTPASQAKSVAARGTAVYTFQVQNTGSVQDTVLLAKSAAKSGWTTSLGAASIVLQPGQVASFTLTVTAPSKAGSLAETVTASIQADPTAAASGTATTSVAK